MQVQCERHAEHAGQQQSRYEIARRIHEFGNIAHVWSIYEARRAPDDTTPERRGINSIQLYRDERGHWRIMSMIWDNERPGLGVDWSV